MDKRVLRRRRRSSAPHTALRRFYDDNPQAKWVNAALAVAGGVAGLVGSGLLVGVLMGFGVAVGSYFATPWIANEVGDVLKRGG